MAIPQGRPSADERRARASLARTVRFRGADHPETEARRSEFYAAKAERLRSEADALDSLGGAA